MGKRLIIIIIQGSVNFQFGEFDDGARGGKGGGRNPMFSHNFHNFLSHLESP